MPTSRLEVLFKKRLGLARRIDTAVMRAMAALLGINVGASATFTARALLRPGGGRIRISVRASLARRSDAAALGVARPVILRCLTPQASIEIGDDAGLSGTAVYPAMRVTIGNRCLMGADVTIFDTDFHPYVPEGRRYAVPDWPQISAPVVIGDNMFIGTGMVVQKGVTINGGAIVAARSVVTKDVPTRTIVGGNLATVLRAAIAGTAAGEPD